MENKMMHRHLRVMTARVGASGFLSEVGSEWATKWLFSGVHSFRFVALALPAKSTHFVNGRRAGCDGEQALQRNRASSHFVWSVIILNSSHVTIAFHRNTGNIMP